MKLFDPTTPPAERTIALAPRRADLRGLRVGLVENTKFNSDAILARVGARLTHDHAMTLVPMHRKRSPSHGVTEEAADAIRRVADFVVSGVGD